MKEDTKDFSVIYGKVSAAVESILAEGYDIKDLIPALAFMLGQTTAIYLEIEDLDSTADEVLDHVSPWIDGGVDGAKKGPPVAQ